MGWFDSFFGEKEHPAHQFRKNGFNEFNKAFNSHPATPDLDYEMEVIIKVRVIGDCKKFTWDEAKIKENGIVGFVSHPPNRIELLCKVVNGRVVFNQATLGHEFNHILSWMGPGKLIANPDKLKKLFK